MGNKAVITTNDKTIGVYLHWNGGRDSVEPLLTYCKIKGYRAPESDCYGWARLCQVIGNFFGGSTNVGIDLYSKLNTDNFDNGVYIIENWEIIGREYYKGYEQNNHDLKLMLIGINSKQPLDEQIPVDYFKGEMIPTSDLKLGDSVFWSNHGDIKQNTIVGFGNGVSNGRNRVGVPYIDYYPLVSGEINCNNYLTENSYMAVRKG